MNQLVAKKFQKLFTVGFRQISKMAAPRFELYVKADSSGKAIGECPFSMKSLMVMSLKTKMSQDLVKVIPVDITNKPDYFLKLNPAGTAPVLVDKENDKVITDSAEIVAHLDKCFPKVDVQHGYNGPAVDLVAGIFPKVVALLKNNDQSKSSELKEAMTQELKKLDEYLKTSDNKFLLGDNLSELDCNLIPKLKHLSVAGNFYRHYQIPSDLLAVTEYVKRGFSCPCFHEICPSDSEFVHGWKRHGLIPDTA